MKTTPALSGRSGVLCLFLILTVALGCARAPSPPRYQPYESAIQIMTDFKIHADDDLYRFGYPRDLAGHNLFRATLRRIDNFEALYPGQFADILAVTRGQILERLGDYTVAIYAYGNLGADPLVEMRAVAQQSLGNLEELNAIANRPCDSSSLPVYLMDLACKSDDLTAFAAKRDGTHWGILARIESEQADRERVLLLFHNRYVLPDGLSNALQAASDLTQRHSQSRLAAQHQLMLGDFYFAAAKDYVVLNDPARNRFEDETFDALVAQAREIYFETSLLDGSPEKPQGATQLRALEAFATTVAEQRR